MSEIKTYKFYSGEYTEFRPSEWLNNRDGEYNGNWSTINNNLDNWFCDAIWVDLVYDIKQISEDIILVVWNSLYIEQGSYRSYEVSLYKGLLK